MSTILKHTSEIYPVVGVPGHPQMVLVHVLTVGDIEDYAVYAGIVPDVSGWDEDAAAARVAQRGQKISRTAALKLFPEELAGKAYRA